MLAHAVDRMRAARYGPASATLALRSALPLDTSASLLRNAFSFDQKLLARRVHGSRSAALPAVESDQFPTTESDLTWKTPPIEEGGEPLALEVVRGGNSLFVAWSVPSGDPVASSRQKPLAVLGEALTSPHAGFLLLRRGSTLLPSRRRFASRSPSC